MLQTIKFSESSVITKLFTQDLGLVSFVVKGIRTAKTQQKSALFQPMTMLQIDFNFQQNKNLHYIKEYRRDVVYRSIPFEMPKTAVGLFLTEMLTKIVREQESNEELFELIYDSFLYIDGSADFAPDFHLQFLVQLSRLLGFEPHEPQTEQENYFHLREGRFFEQMYDDSLFLNAKESRAFLQLLHANLFQPLPVRFTRSDRKNMLEKLLLYYSLHIENFHYPKSLDVLESIFDG